MTPLEERILALLRNITSQLGLPNCDIDLKPLRNTGANYCSTMFLAKITSDVKVLNLFVKVATLGESIRELTTASMYDVEHIAYSTIFKLYDELENKHKVPEEHRLKLPHYYGSSMNNMEELLVLDDLTAKGYVCFDRLQSVDWEYAVTAMQVLAKHHALSVAVRLQHKEEYDKFASKLKNFWFSENAIKVVWQFNYHKALKVVREENKERFEKFLKYMDGKAFAEHLMPLKFNIISHNDFRVSNLLHRREKDGNLDMILVDYQTIQEGCIITDLLYFVFTGTDQEFRRKHFQPLMDHYYTLLCEAMKRLGIDSEQVYPKTDFDYELKERLPIGLALAAAYMPLITVDTKDAPELQGLEREQILGVKTSDLFTQRMNEIVDDYVEWGVI